eukprot:1809518-Rhodomonas_salina.5
MRHARKKSRGASAKPQATSSFAQRTPRCEGGSFGSPSQPSASGTMICEAQGSAIQKIVVTFPWSAIGPVTVAATSPPTCGPNPKSEECVDGQSCGEITMTVAQTHVTTSAPL